MVGVIACHLLGIITSYACLYASVNARVCCERKGVACISGYWISPGNTFASNADVDVMIEFASSQADRSGMRSTRFHLTISEHCANTVRARMHVGVDWNE